MTDQELKDLFVSLNEKQKETWARMDETNREARESISESMRELKRAQKETWAQIGGMSRSSGEFAENLFFHSLEKSKSFAGVHFDTVSNHFKMLKKMPDGTRLEDQFDIVMINDNAVAIIEVKYRAQSEDPKEMIERKVPNFRTLFSDYADFKIYLGLGSFAFDEFTVKEAKKLGIGLLKVSGDMVEYKTDWVRAY